MITVYLDLDGVLANFNKKAEELVGSNWEAEVSKPNWGKLSDIQNLYEILEPMSDAHMLFDFFEDKHDVEILTAIPRRAYFPDAVDHKREWVWKHFGRHVKVNFGPYAKDKQYHCKRGDVLIDDMEINIQQWKARYGVGILHTSAIESIINFKKEYEE